ncbi:U-snRNP-associated cyclophilin family protein, partial [Toxoplasma gondii RUB]
RVSPEPSTDRLQRRDISPNHQKLYDP